MTRNRVQQRAIRERMATTGEPYAVARRHIAHTEAGPQAAGEAAPLLAADVHAGLVAAFRAAGWPVSADATFDQGEYRCYAGPITIRVRRDCPPRWRSTTPTTRRWTCITHPPWRPAPR